MDCGITSLAKRQQQGDGSVMVMILNTDGKWKTSSYTAGFIAKLSDVAKSNVSRGVVPQLLYTHG